MTLVGFGISLKAPILLLVNILLTTVSYYLWRDRYIRIDQQLPNLQ